MHFVVAAILSYLAGIGCYILTLKIVWDQTLGGDTFAVLFWGAIAFFIIACPIYLLVITLIDKVTKQYKFLFYPLGCMLVFFIPTSFILASFGDFSYKTLFSPEAMLFHAFFLSAGLIFGLSIWKLRNLGKSA
ncbi:hypothetical protein [Solibacillus sp. CAU 1738]|uniref:hypothetical protein n=1 Tax=Solibacillus sp. CAU 1738 TaxID=3140363 RepID=UPI00326107FC